MVRKPASASATALVVLLRGVNVGGHRTFRPSLLAEALAKFDVVSVGAAGTFVVRRPGPHAAFQAALLAKLPFATEVVLCNGADLLRLETASPFGPEPPGAGVTRFVSFLSQPARREILLPAILPPEGEWLVRIVAVSDRMAFGEYRRHPNTIRHLGKVDKLFGVPVTTRNWNTIDAIVRVLKGEGRKRP